MTDLRATNELFTNTTIPIKDETKNARTSSACEQILYGIFNHDKGVNGKIDEKVFQGNEGDCWLISGLISYSCTEEGSKILQNAIKQKDDGNYEVVFKGIGKTIEVTKDELDRANVSTFANGIGLSSSKYSTGDDDVLLMELAFEKLTKDKSVPIETIDGITGGNAYYLYRLLSDNVVGYSNDDAKDKANLLGYYNNHQDTCSATIGVSNGFSGLENNHAYAVKSLNDSKISLINPWNSGKEIKVPLNDMLLNINNYDISVTDSTIKEGVKSYQEYYA